MNDDLRWLTEWYLSQCDGDWEHSFGVKIDTLDNPGWLLSIDLADTGLDDHPFEPIKQGVPADDLEEWQRSGSWWLARVQNGMFEASCGPLDLGNVIAVFRAWVEQGRAAANASA